MTPVMGFNRLSKKLRQCRVNPYLEYQRCRRQGDAAQQGLIHYKKGNERNEKAIAVGRDASPIGITGNEKIKSDEGCGKAVRRDIARVQRVISSFVIGLALFSVLRVMTLAAISHSLAVEE
jgi:hypothetical protein